MKIVMYVSNAGSNANRPGAAQNNLRLSLPPKDGDQIDDENKEAFPDEKTKSGTSEFQGLADALQAQFKGGQRVVVTIEVME